MTTLKGYLYSSFTFSQAGIRKVITERRISLASGIIFLMLMAVLVSIVTVWLRGEFRRFMFNHNVTPIDSTDDSVSFRRISVADGTTKDGFRFSSYLYKTSDCVGVSYDVVFFDSASRAQEELQKRASTASEILEHGAEKDESGKPVGERFVIKSIGSGEAPANAAIVIVRNSDLISITSPSLTHLLKFDKASKGAQNSNRSFGVSSLRDISFASVSSTEGFTSDGIPFKQEKFTSSDCENLIKQTWNFDSAEKARQALEKFLNNAIEISERGDKVNSVGERVGKRAVADFEAKPGSGHIELTNILWTEGAILHSIEGPYVYALEFESRGGRASSGLARR